MLNLTILKHEKLLNIVEGNVRFSLNVEVKQLADRRKVDERKR